MATFNKGMKYLRHKIIEDLKEIGKKYLYYEGTSETIHGKIQRKPLATKTGC